MKTIFLFLLLFPIVAYSQHNMKRVADTHAPPYSYIVNLNYKVFLSGRKNATGFFISPRQILTNAHAVRYSKDIYVIPAADGGDLAEVAKVKAPFGMVEIDKGNVKIPKGFVYWQFLRRLLKRRRLDYAIIELPDDKLAKSICGCEYPIIPFKLFAWDSIYADTLHISLSGYPINDKVTPKIEPRSQWKSEGVLAVKKDNLANRSGTVYHDLNSYGGNSGSPIWSEKNGQLMVVAIHGYGGLGIVVHPRMLNDLKKWGVPIP